MNKEQLKQLTNDLWGAAGHWPQALTFFRLSGRDDQFQSLHATKMRIEAQ